jgi:hypothetical protein
MPVTVPGTGTGPRHVLELLRGCWAIDRRIEPGGHFTGVACFTEHSVDSLMYRENGWLVLADGSTLKGRNSYVYDLCEANIKVSFSDGSIKGAHFIDIAVPDDYPNDRPIVSIDRHHCGQDIYDTIFCIENRAHFRVTYVVKGPTKAYVSHTVYRRLKKPPN